MTDVQSKPMEGASAREGLRPPSTPWFHELRRLTSDPHVAIHEMVGRYGDFMRWRGFYDLYIVNHPEYIRPVLSQGYDRFSKRTIDYRVLAQVMGKGLVTSDGPHWVKQRKLMQPVFSGRNIDGFDKTINALTSSLMSEWDARPRDEIVWFDREMTRLTFGIVGATLFGSDIERHAQEVADILDIANLNSQEPRALMTLFPWIPTPYNLKWKRAVKRLDGIVYGLIAARRRAGAGSGEILDRLIDARDEETGEGMEETQIRDEVVTLMMAGHETSAVALAWTLYLLSTHPEIEARLAAELTAHLSGAPATAADLPRIPYWRHQSRALYQCRGCRYHVSLTAGNIVASTKLPLRTWFLAMYLVTQTQNGISALELSRHLSVSFNTAWKGKHKLMQVMKERNDTRPSGRWVQFNDAY